MSCAIGKLRHFFGVFRLMIDPVGRAEENGFHAESAFDQALREIQLPTQLGGRDFVKDRMRVGVIANSVALGVFAFREFRVTGCRVADNEERCRDIFSLRMSRILGVQRGSGRRQT